MVIATSSVFRARLLREARGFIHTAVSLAGVERIALLGSLLTEKLDPKDVDLLVTVANDADLTPLAAAARRLQGHTQSLGAGADVFLADPAGHYLGRTCPWRECWPGRRVSCDARHCGHRRYLHDDLDTITLDAALIAEPPLELYPGIRRRVSVPADVDEFMDRVAPGHGTG